MLCYSTENKAIVFDNDKDMNPVKIYFSYLPLPTTFFFIIPLFFLPFPPLSYHPFVFLCTCSLMPVRGVNFSSLSQQSICVFKCTKNASGVCNYGELE